MAHSETSVSYGIFVMDADGSRRRRVTSMGGAPVWSPDGSRIAFELHRSALGLPGGGSDIYVVDVEGGAPVNITDSTPGQYAVAPDWSPARRWFLQRVSSLPKRAGSAPGK